MTKKPTYEELEQRVKKLEQVEFERKREEEEKARLLAIIDESPDFIGTADMQGTSYITTGARREWWDCRKMSTFFR